MLKFFKNKWFRIPYTILLYAFSIYGFFLTVSYFAMKYEWTKDEGMIDSNNRYFQNMDSKYNQSYKLDSISIKKNRYKALNRIILLNEFYPLNAKYILDAYTRNQDEKLALQMLDAVDLKLKSNNEYKIAVQQLNNRKINKQKTSSRSAFEWMNLGAWKAFTVAVKRDRESIDSVAKVTGVESRLIVSCLAGEQIRMFNSRRQSFKKYISPLQSLVLETNLSYGVTGIKVNTAINIEKYLKDPNSVYYLGKKFEHLLDYDSSKTYGNALNGKQSMRIRRLVQYKDHFYSYLYAAIFMKQIKMQWERAGYPLDNRPEILASLFNLGFRKSVPKKDPAVGGSNYLVGESMYTFGAVAFEFYYSGELLDVFPYQKKHFDWDTN